MPRICGVCCSLNRDSIDAAIRAGTPTRRIAKRFGLSRGSVIRHAKNHIAPEPDPPPDPEPAEQVRESAFSYAKAAPEPAPEPVAERPAELEHTALFGLQVERWERTGTRGQFLVVHALDPEDPWVRVKATFSPGWSEPFVERSARSAAEIAELRRKYEAEGKELPPRTAGLGGWYPESWRY